MLFYVPSSKGLDQLFKIIIILHEHASLADRDVVACRDCHGFDLAEKQLELAQSGCQSVQRRKRLGTGTSGVDLPLSGSKLLHGQVEIIEALSGRCQELASGELGAQPLDSA